MQMPEVTIGDLEDSSGQDESYYSEYIETAIRKATLLLRLALCRDEFPDDELTESVLREAIIEMALSLHQNHKYFEANTNPFSSETIGSYSYQKRAQQIQAEGKTGLAFFDHAIDKYSLCDLEDASKQLSSGGYIMSNPTQVIDTGNYKTAIFPLDRRYPGTAYGERF